MIGIDKKNFLASSFFHFLHFCGCCTCQLDCGSCCDVMQWWQIETHILSTQRRSQNTRGSTRVDWQYRSKQKRRLITPSSSENQRAFERRKPFITIKSRSFDNRCHSQRSRSRYFMHKTMRFRFGARQILKACHDLMFYFYFCKCEPNVGCINPETQKTINYAKWHIDDARWLRESDIKKGAGGTWDRKEINLNA